MSCSARYLPKRRRSAYTDTPHAALAFLPRRRGPSLVRTCCQHCIDSDITWVVFLVTIMSFPWGPGIPYVIE
ncbi:hypothetical protein MRX96_029519 [Rhipicephalus microplus]